MSLFKYLPSAQFAVIVAALLISGGLVFGAQYITKKPAGPSLSASQQTNFQSNWQQTLDEIQAQSGATLPEVPSEDTVSQLIDQAQSSNLTDSVAKSLLIKLTDAKAQGLGDDIPTQDQLVADALSQAGTAQSAVYAYADLTVVPTTKDSLHTYGNAFIIVNKKYPQANSTAVLTQVGYALDYNSSKYLTQLPAEAADYAALAKELSTLPVPETLAPLHLKIVNDLSAMGSAAVDMESALEDPLRGLRGFQAFNAQGDEASNLLTTIAETFTKDGILFTKDEAGASWSAFQSAP